MIHNFNPGPSALPGEVLQSIQAEIVNFQHIGYSLLEASHRSSVYQDVHNHTLKLLRNILAVPSDMEILLLPGGASLQFAMIPLNFTHDRGAAFIISGAWSKKAHAEAQKATSGIKALWDGSSSNFTSLPSHISEKQVYNYIHITSNETIHGVQWKEYPHTQSPLVVDMSSDIGTSPIQWSHIDCAYAGAQKNLGVAGVTVLIIRKDFLDMAKQDLPSYLSYRVHAEHNSLYNTPPVYAIWVMEKVLSWALENGGINTIQSKNREKSSLVYTTIDRYHDIYRLHPSVNVRSTISVVFTLPDQNLENHFLNLAQKEQFIGLRGHRSIGGIRISLYSHVLLSSVKALCQFMEHFAKTLA